MRREEYIIGTARSLPLSRWWLKTRPCKLAIQLGPPGMRPVVEFYVPVWAWPLEIMYRLIFGSSKLKSN
jgi:hypothetical protein